MIKSTELEQVYIINDMLASMQIPKHCVYNLNGIFDVYMHCRKSNESWIINDGLRECLNNIKIPTDLIIKHIKEVNFENLMRIIKRLNNLCKEVGRDFLYSKEEIKLINTHFMFYGKK